MTNPDDTLAQAGAMNAEPSDPEEAARYALLQRLAPALQHHMMGQFQSMGMIAAMMEKRLQSTDPDLAGIRKDCASLSSVSQTAVNSIINMMTWIEPRPATAIRFDAGVRECLGLLATQFRFKGFAIVNEVPEIDASVSSQALRSVLCATLIAFSDLSQTPADLVIRAQTTVTTVEMSIRMRASERSTKNAYPAAYRLLRWRDVQTLATAEAVQLTHDGASAHLTFSHALEESSPGLPDDHAFGSQR